jgi:uncharacterized repeat protein (TIGR01451 family)
LKITKTHVDTFTAGHSGTYRLTVENLGTAPTTGDILVTDHLPNGLTYLSATGPGWNCTSSTAHNVVCIHSEPLSPHAPALSLTLIVSVGANTHDVIVNTATVSSSGDVDTTNDTATDTVRKNAVLAPTLSPAGLTLLIFALLGVAAVGFKRVTRLRR